MFKLDYKHGLWRLCCTSCDFVWGLGKEGQHRPTSAGSLRHLCPVRMEES